MWDFPTNFSSLQPALGSWLWFSSSPFYQLSTMSEIYVGNLDPNVTTRKIELEFGSYGEIHSIEMIQSATSTKNCAFVRFKNHSDALIAIQSWNHKFTWRVELSHKDIENKGVEQLQSGRMSTWKPVPPPLPPWLELPKDITASILEKLDPMGLPIALLWTAQKVCTTWRKICRDPTMWRVIDMWKFRDVDDIYELPYCGKLKLFRLAVDLSQGQATEINIEGFGSYDLLDYVAERCRNLRCLRLAHYLLVYGESLSKAVTGFPLLQELHLHCTPVEIDVIEAIGQSCPMLKTFALNACASTFGIRESNEEALAVATFMPKLRRLQLFRNRMTNEGLEAILNGCPKLESLDIRQCLNLNLEVEQAKRCARQIKTLRLPQDLIHDYEWDAKDPHTTCHACSFWESMHSSEN